MSDINTYNDCINIIEDKKKLNNKELLEKWNSFKNYFPQLYQMLIMTESIDLQLLKFLCDTAEKQNKLTKDEQLENEFKIGDKLAQKFIYDKFPEPNNKQKEFIKESLRKKINNNINFDTSNINTNVKGDKSEDTINEDTSTHDTNKSED